METGKRGSQEDIFKLLKPSGFSTYHQV